MRQAHTSKIRRFDPSGEKNGENVANPALEVAYKNLRPQDRVLFVDETYNAPGEGMEHTFYTVCGVLISDKDLADTRDDLVDITGKTFWHTTQELRTPEGRATAVDLLKFCRDVDDLYFLAHRTPLTPEQSTEEARQDCLRSLFSHVGEAHPETRLIVIEKRQDHSHDDADRSLVKKMRSNGTISRQTQVILTSPSSEYLLWLPDLVAMAFRRQLTHQDETAQYFTDYVEHSTTILKT